MKPFRRRDAVLGFLAVFPLPLWENHLIDRALCGGLGRGGQPAGHGDVLLGRPAVGGSASAGQRGRAVAGISDAVFRPWGIRRENCEAKG